MNWNLGRKDLPVSFDQLLAEWPMLQVSTLKVVAGVRPACWSLARQSLKCLSSKYFQEKSMLGIGTPPSRA